MFALLAPVLILAAGTRRRELWSLFGRWPCSVGHFRQNSESFISRWKTIPSAPAALANLQRAARMLQFEPASTQVLLFDTEVYGHELARRCLGSGWGHRKRR